MAGADDLPRRWHLPADAIRNYLGTANWSDIVRSMERLSTVQVQYDFRDAEWRRHGRIALVNVGFKKSLKDSTTKFVEFELPARIRRLMVEARDYALLELGAFPRFRCKYTAIMYQRLALRAGYDPNLIRPWEIEPAKLAEALGYPTVFGKSHTYVRHTFRHTCATWLMWAGEDINDVAAYMSMTREMVEKVYGHHHPDSHSAIGASFSTGKAGRRVGRNRRERNEVPRQFATETPGTNGDFEASRKGANPVAAGV